MKRSPHERFKLLKRIKALGSIPFMSFLFISFVFLFDFF